MRPLGAVRVMAIGALDEPFVHAMPKRHGELRLLLLMAGIAKLRLRLDQEKLAGLRVVRRMARSTRDVALGMQGIDGV